MPEFVCRLGAPDGSVLEQRRLAASADALRRELETEGFHIFSLTAAGARISIPFLSRREKVSGQEFLLFNTQLRTLLRAGLPLAQSLDLLKDQQASPVFRALLTKVHRQVTTGVSLSDAFLSLGETFPRLYANSLRAGERSGELATVLGRYIEYQRLVESVRKKVISALVYPAVLIFLAIVLVVVLMVYVIPKFTEFYAGFDAELPGITKAVIYIATTSRDHFWLILIVTAVAIAAIKLWSKTPSGRMVVHRVMLRLPLIGKLSHLFSQSQFSRSLGLLLGGGTPMVPALETSATSVNNAYVSEILLGCVPKVQQGEALSDTLRAAGLTPSLALAMIRVGESTGALPDMLNHTSEFFDEEIDYFLARIVSLIEPAILVFMGLVVAGLLLAVYYPLLTLVHQL